MCVRPRKTYPNFGVWNLGPDKAKDNGAQRTDCIPCLVPLIYFLLVKVVNETPLSVPEYSGSSGLENLLEFKPENQPTTSLYTGMVGAETNLFSSADGSTRLISATRPDSFYGACLGENVPGTGYGCFLF